MTATDADPAPSALAERDIRLIIFGLLLAIVSISAFLVASALAGLSQTMNQLVAFRPSRGVGGGGLQALAFIIIGDILSPRDRGR